MIKGASFSEATLIFGILNGIALSVAAALYVKALSCGPFVISAALFGVSSLLPVAYCAIYPGEALSLWQYVGYILLIACGFAMVRKSEHGEKKEINKKWVILILSATLTNSMIPYGIRLQSQKAPDESLEMLVLYFGVACFLNFIWAARAKCFDVDWKQKAANAWPLALVMAFSICLNTWVQSRIGAGNIPAVIQFPILNAGGLWLSVVTGRIFYSEKLTMLQYVVLVITIFSGVLITM